MTGTETDPDHDGLVNLGADISPDTHIASTHPVVKPEVTPSPAHPDALVEGNVVGDGTELE
ncbi:hypothetical protein BH11ACT3_BH11ACT3_18010 [soil metagenome]